MSEDSLNHIEKKIDDHVVKHDEDYKRLLIWVITTLVALIGATATWFTTVGALQEKVSQLEIRSSNSISRDEWEGSLDLFDEKFKNINDKLDDIKNGLNIK